MTAAPRDTSPGRSEDTAISAAVLKLMGQRDESVTDLAYHTRISVASIYRKLGGQASWKAADIGAVARHYSVRPGDLFLGEDIDGRPTTPPNGPNGGQTVRHQGLEPRTRWFRTPGPLRPGNALVRAA